MVSLNWYTGQDEYQGSPLSPSDHGCIRITGRVEVQDVDTTPARPRDGPVAGSAVGHNIVLHGYLGNEVFKGNECSRIGRRRAVS